MSSIGSSWASGSWLDSTWVNRSWADIETAAPDAPTVIAPPNAAVNVNVRPVLSWSAAGATSYDVYFGTSATPPLVVSGQSATTYFPSLIAYSTVYYWKIVAINGIGSTTGAVWSFRTQALPVRGAIDMEFSGRGNGWTQVDDVLKSPGISWHRGLPGTGVLDTVADIGTLSFSLDNSERNEAGLVGYYSPDSANCRAGFRLGIGIRYRIGLNVRFTGVLDSIDPVPGRHGARTVSCEAVDWMNTASRTRIGGLPVQINKHGDEIFQTLLDSLDPSARPDAVEKDLSTDTYPYALDKVRDEQTVLRDELYRLCVSGLDRCWLRGNGTLVYESRVRRSTAASNVDTFTDSNGFVAKRDRTGVVNRVQSTVHPRQLGTESVLLYLLYTPTLIVPGQTLTITGPWTDPNSPNVRVGAVTLDPVVAGTDYLVNSAADGSGTDLTSFLSVSTGSSGNATQFTLSLGGGIPGYIVKLQQRGVPLYDYGDTIVQWDDSNSISQYGLTIQPIDMSYQANPSFGLEAAQYIIFTSAQPLTQISGFVRYVDIYNATELARSVDRDVSDRIGLVDPVTGINRSFFINAIDESEHDGVLKTEFLLAAADTTAYWLLEVPGRSELDHTTILGFGLIRGHIDTPHADTHGDTAHADVPHGDSNHNDVAAQSTHGDAGTHVDTPHSDVAHGDSAHNDSHGDSAHGDVSHSDAAHGDSHTDIAHTDWAVGIDHEDTHGDAHADSQHLDEHGDLLHTDGILTDFHTDSHGDIAHDDTPHDDSHGDVPHHDTHGDSPHGDSGTSTPHTDTPHTDSSHSDSHGDSGHVDSHTDVAHGDASHSDFHADVAHGDVPHSDSLHTDTIHTDTHGDTAHGDVS